MKTQFRKTALCTAALLIYTLTPLLAQDRQGTAEPNYARLFSDLLAGGLLFVLLLIGLGLLQWAKKLRRQAAVRQLVNGNWLKDWEGPNSGRGNQLGFYRKNLQHKNKS